MGVPIIVTLHGPAGELLYRRAFAAWSEAAAAAGKCVDRAEPFGGAPFGPWADCRERALALTARGDVDLPNGGKAAITTTTWPELASEVLAAATWWDPTDERARREIRPRWNAQHGVGLMLDVVAEGET